MRMFFIVGLLAAFMPAPHSAFAEEPKAANQSKPDPIMIYANCISNHVQKLYGLEATAYEVADAAHGSCTREYREVAEDYDKRLFDKLGPFPGQEIEAKTEKAVKDWKERFRYEAIADTLFLRLADKNKQQAKPAQ